MFCTAASSTRGSSPVELLEAVSMVVSGVGVPGTEGCPSCAQVLAGVLREAADVSPHKGDACNALVENAGHAPLHVCL